MKNLSVLPFHSVLQGIIPTLKYRRHSFLPSLSPYLTAKNEYDDSITTYFLFYKRQFPKKSDAVFT